VKRVALACICVLAAIAPAEIDAVPFSFVERKPAIISVSRWMLGFLTQLLLRPEV